MDPISISLLLLAAAVILLLGELLLPTQGVLGIFGLLCIAGAIAATFLINTWLGLGVLTAAILATPFVWGALIRVWEKSPVGKRMILQPSEPSRAIIPIKLGQIGIAVSELRPMGEVDFEDQRLSAIAERGMIRAGESVRVVAVVNGRATVRPVAAETVASAESQPADFESKG